MVGGSVVLSVLAVVLAMLGTLVANRRVRDAERAAKWARERAENDLVALADLADQEAGRGVERPGTAGLLTLYPSFDFTRDGSVVDPRGTQESRAQDADGGGTVEG